MVPGSGVSVRPRCVTAIGAALSFALLLAASPAAAQTGTVNGRVVDERGAGIASAQVFLVSPAIATQTGSDGNYSLQRVPAGSQTVRVRMVGYRPDSATVTVEAGGTASQDFSLTRDPLQLQEMVVTATQTPRTNLDASVAVTTLSAEEVERSVPRSTTEMLRYVPGFTRVESSGGEVNSNISIRGILGVEYVMFMEDGMPVYPTMHTYFMNADNLFRFDENIEKLEVVRGGASALFGSNTPGAIINYINKTGGDQFAGTMRATVGTHALGPLRSERRGAHGRELALQRGRILPVRPRRARPRFPRHSRRPAQGQRDPGALQRLHPRLGEVHRRPQPVHLAAAAEQPRRSRLHLGLQQLRRAAHQRGHRSPGADPGG